MIYWKDQSRYEHPETALSKSSIISGYHVLATYMSSTQCFSLRALTGSSKKHQWIEPPKSPIINDDMDLFYFKQMAGNLQVREQNRLQFVLFLRTLGGDKVSMLTHRFPHKPLRNGITRLTAQFCVAMMSDLVICKFRKVWLYVTPNVLTETRCHQGE